MAKHLTIYGPGTTPNVVVEDDKAEEILKKIKGGEDIDEYLDDGNEHIFIKAKDCWAVHSKSWTGKGRRKEDQKENGSEH